MAALQPINIPPQPGNMTFGVLFTALAAHSIAVVVVAYLFWPPINAWVEQKQPVVNVPPPVVEVSTTAMADVLQLHLSKHLSNLTYFELSVLIDAEMTSFMRMYNHYQQKPSEQLKQMMVVQSQRLDTILAAREDMWIQETRELGDRFNEFTPLSPLLRDMMEQVGITGTDASPYKSADDLDL